MRAIHPITPPFCLLQAASRAALGEAAKAAVGGGRVLVYVASDEVDETMAYLEGRGGGAVFLSSQHVREYVELKGGDKSLLPMVMRAVTTPRTSHLIPHTSHLTPRTSHLAPHTSNLASHTSHVRS